MNECVFGFSKCTSIESVDSTYKLLAQEQWRWKSFEQWTRITCYMNMWSKPLAILYSKMQSFIITVYGKKKYFYFSRNVKERKIERKCHPQTVEITLPSFAIYIENCLHAKYTCSKKVIVIAIATVRYSHHLWNKTYSKESAYGKHVPVDHHQNQRREKRKNERRKLPRRNNHFHGINKNSKWEKFRLKH